MKSGYIGITLILLFFLFAGAFLTFMPNVRFYKDMAKQISGSQVMLVKNAQQDVDDFISASVLSLGVSDSTVGLSFDDFSRNRRAKEETKKLQRALTSSGWKFPSGALADMFTPVTGDGISALVPNLNKQINRGYISPNILVVEGNLSKLRSVWNVVAGQITSQTDIPFMETLW
jgi:hypothetical protein